MKDHLFVADDGSLNDARIKNWFERPLRKNYRRHYPWIRSVAEFKATLRAGKYAWPGGYPLFFTCNDAEAMCFTCARKQARSVMHEIKNKGSGRIIACEINYECDDLCCVECNERIESAYGDN